MGSLFMDWVSNFLPPLWAGMRAIAAVLVMRVLGAFGLSVISFNALLPPLKAFVQGYASALPAPALAFLGAIGVDKAMTMILSALVVVWGSKIFIVPKAVADAMPGSQP
jgi:hypothetical protein